MPLPHMTLATVQPRRLLRGLLLIWVGLVDLWAFGSAWFTQQFCALVAQSCLQKSANPSAQAGTGMWLALLALLVLVNFALLTGALSERLPVRWRWSYFLAQAGL